MAENVVFRPTHVDISPRGTARIRCDDGSTITLVNQQDPAEALRRASQIYYAYSYALSR